MTKIPADRTPHGHLTSVGRKVGYIKRHGSREDLLAYMASAHFIASVRGAKYLAGLVYDVCTDTLHRFDCELPEKTDWKSDAGQFLLARLRKEAPRCRSNRELASKLALPLNSVKLARSIHKIPLAGPAAAGMALAA